MRTRMLEMEKLSEGSDDDQEQDQPAQPAVDAGSPPSRTTRGAVQVGTVGRAMRGPDGVPLPRSGTIAAALQIARRDKLQRGQVYDESWRTQFSNVPAKSNPPGSPGPMTGNAETLREQRGVTMRKQTPSLPASPRSPLHLWASPRSTPEQGI